MCRWERSGTLPNSPDPHSPALVGFTWDRGAQRGRPLQPPGGRRWIKSGINHVHSHTMANIFLFTSFFFQPVPWTHLDLVYLSAGHYNRYVFDVTQFDKTRSTRGADRSLRLPILVNIQRASPLLSSSLITWNPFVAQLRFHPPTPTPHSC